MMNPINENIPQNNNKPVKGKKVSAGQFNNIECSTIDNANEPIKAGAYIRVSTDEQAESGYGLQTQRERIAGALTMKGWTLYKEYEDGGQSGGKLDRPALQEMLEDINAGRIQAVVVFKLDRLSRSVRDTVELIEDKFKPLNVELFSVSESLDLNSPTGQLMVNILSSFAQYERDVITARLSGGRKTKARTGGYAGGNPAIGYTTERGKKTLFADKDKADTVRRVFALNADGMKLQQIADQLNAEGHTTKQGARFTPTQVMRILNRRGLYSGVYTYSGITADGQHRAII
jgi:site-specific DNA recombinase